MDKMIAPGDPLGMAEDAGPGVWSRSKAYDMGSVRDGSVVPIVGEMVERDVDGHGE